MSERHELRATIVGTVIDAGRNPSHGGTHRVQDLVVLQQRIGRVATLAVDLPPFRVGGIANMRGDFGGERQVDVVGGPLLINGRLQWQVVAYDGAPRWVSELQLEEIR